MNVVPESSIITRHTLDLSTPFNLSVDCPHSLYDHEKLQYLLSFKNINFRIIPCQDHDVYIFITMPIAVPVILDALESCMH